MIYPATIFFVPDLLPWDSPADVALEEEVARCKKEVHQGKVRLDKALSHEKGLLRYFREALMASAWRRFMAKFLVLMVSPYHLTVPVADGHKFVQCVDDWRVRQRISSLPYEVVSEEKRVLKMDDVWLVGEQELAKVLGVNVFMGRRHKQPIEIRDIRVKEILVWILVYRGKQRPLMGTGHS